MNKLQTLQRLEEIVLDMEEKVTKPPPKQKVGEPDDLYAFRCEMQKRDNKRRLAFREYCLSVRKVALRMSEEEFFDA